MLLILITTSFFFIHEISNKFTARGAFVFLVSPFTLHLIDFVIILMNLMSEGDTFTTRGIEKSLSAVVFWIAVPADKVLNHL